MAKPGIAFGEYIFTEKPSRFRDESSKTSTFVRYFLILFFLFLSCGILLARLFYIQVVEGSYYKKLSDSNRIRTAIIHAPRGIIFDRNAIPLVFNIPGFRLVQGDKTKLITREKALPLIAQGQKGLEVDALRQYPYKDITAHVLGYTGQVSEEELESFNYKEYSALDLIGKMGIEKRYEGQLKGVDGKKLVEVESSGKPIRTLGQTDAIAGQDITLTLDIDLQKAAYEALKEAEKGVIIATNAHGEVLALVSKPSFDANLFTLDETYKPSSDSPYKTIMHVLSDSDNQPLLNRAISGVYPPGSTFKLVTAAAGLEDQKIDESFTVEDTGIMHVGAFSFANWYYTQYGKTEGHVNVVKAIKRSNDIFFYKLAELLGVDRLSYFAKQFGVGQSLGIDLEGESQGVLPTNAWKKKHIGEQWYLGDTYHYGIGQGYLLVTPFQVNAWTSVVANGGILHKPHLLKHSKFDSPSGLTKFLSEKTISLIRQGMIESCSPTGVAWPLFEFRIKNSRFARRAELRIDGKNFFEVPESTASGSLKDYRKVSIACKTGTAQHGGEKTLPHAWITLFAPAYDPEIILTVLVESSGEGSNVAAPVAKKVLEKWFSK